MINAQSFARMKPKAILINTCRGPVVDEPALIEALQTGRILAAGLDTQDKEPADPNNPLLKLPNGTVTPPSAGPTGDGYPKRYGNRYATIQRLPPGQEPLSVVP